MNNENLIEQNKKLLEKCSLLEAELKETKDKLKKYTAPERNKGFYQRNKEEILNKNKEYYKENVTPEKRKEYARTAYLIQKEKKKLLAENI